MSSVTRSYQARQPNPELVGAEQLPAAKEETFFFASRRHLGHCTLSSRLAIFSNSSLQFGQMYS